LSVAGLAEALGTLILVVFLSLLRRPTAAYSELSRLEGFAHAPRSDVARQASLNTFATSLDLSYVSVSPPIHNSFSMVSNTKTVLSMFPTL
jgi:hypothetical protein